MPDTVLPADLASEINDMRRRLTALETFPPGAMTLLAKQVLPFDTNTVYPFTTTFTTMPDALCSFTLLRPVPVLVIAGMPWSTNGGTAAYGLVRAFVSATNASGAVPANDVNGAPMVANPYGQQYNGSGIGVLAATASFVVPAGTWYFLCQYKLNAGATTTLTENSCGVFVYQISG